MLDGSFLFASPKTTEFTSNRLDCFIIRVCYMNSLSAVHFFFFLSFFSFFCSTTSGSLWCSRDNLFMSYSTARATALSRGSITVLWLNLGTLCLQFSMPSLRHTQFIPGGSVLLVVFVMNLITNTNQIITPQFCLN